MSTRQYHIDRQITTVLPCSAHKFIERTNPYMMVVFTNGSWACSSGHSSEVIVPALRIPVLDASAWFATHSVELTKSIPVELCHSHDDGMESYDWGLSGHLWRDGHHQELKLCLPMTKTN